jgi:hypothetical protein
MRNTDRIFILSGAFCAVVGLSIGLWMVAVNDYSYRPIHAHINVLGWVTLAIYGIVYRIYPAMKASRLAFIHLLCSVSGVIFMILGWLMFLENILVGSMTLVVIFRGGASLAIAGVVLFMINLWLNGIDDAQAN